MHKVKGSNLIPLIDDLGDVKAKIAALRMEEDAIRDAMGDLEPGAYEGDRFRMTISDSVRETLDVAAAREKLSPQWVRAHTKTTEVRTIKLVARIGVDVIVPKPVTVIKPKVTA